MIFVDTPIVRENIVTVKAFVRRGDALLFIQAENGRWDVPGGRLDIPESLIDALRREVREEIGVELASIDEEHPWTWYWAFESTSRPLVQNIVGIGYACTLASDALRLAPPEHVAHAWVTADQLEDLNVHGGHRTGYLGWMKLQGMV